MNKNWSIDDLQDIWHLVTKLHQGQTYGGNSKGVKVPYINHIGSVTFEILAALQYNDNNELNPNLAIQCAVLHDSIEDTDFSYEKVLELFGKEVADGVLALTKDKNLPTKKEAMEDSLQRIKAQDKSIWAVKLADRIVNLYAPPYYWNNEKRENYRQEAILIYEALKEGNEYLANRLKMKIENYKAFLIKGNSF